jgi:hypothetical protein
MWHWSRAACLFAPFQLEARAGPVFTAVCGRATRPRNYGPWLVHPPTLPPLYYPRSLLIFTHTHTAPPHPTSPHHTPALVAGPAIRPNPRDYSLPRLCLALRFTSLRTMAQSPQFTTLLRVRELRTYRSGRSIIPSHPTFTYLHISTV